MGDSSFITLLPMVPLLVLVISIAALVLAWRSRRRAVRRVVAFLLIVFGIACFPKTVGTLFSMASGAQIAAMGLLLLIFSHGAKSAA